MGYEVFESLCNQKGVKPYQVSKETGVSTATLSSWKKGVYVPKADKLQKLADYFDVSIDYLMTGEQPTDYYLNEETAKAAQEIFDNPELRLLFDEARNADPEDLKTVHQMLLALKRKENGEV